MQKLVSIYVNIALGHALKTMSTSTRWCLQMIANSITTVPSSEVIPFLLSYSVKERVDSFVVGYPKQMNNSPSEAVKYIDPFIAELKRTFPGKEVYLMDERFTSKIAQQAMISGGVKKKDRQNKALIDAVSATIILQSFMEYRDNNKQPTTYNF